MGERQAYVANSITVLSAKDDVLLEVLLLEMMCY